VAGTGVGVVRLASRDHDAVVLQYRRPEAETAAFLAWLRAAGSPARELPVILVAERADLIAAEGFLGRGATRLLDTSLAPHLLHLVLREILEVAPRFGFAAPVRLGPPAQGRLEVPAHPSGSSCGRTVNVSASGMLVKIDRRDPPGSLLSFELELPEEPEPLRGWAEVVRTGRSPHDEDAAIGLRIRSFSRDGLLRYTACLDRLTA
jgi:hypothetical protein